MKLMTSIYDLDRTEETASEHLFDAVGGRLIEYPSGELCECGEIWAMHEGLRCPETGEFRSVGVIIWYDGTLHAKGIATEEEQAFLTLAAALLGAA